MSRVNFSPSTFRLWVTRLVSSRIWISLAFLLGIGGFTLSGCVDMTDMQKRSRRPRTPQDKRRLRRAFLRKVPTPKFPLKAQLRTRQKGKSLLLAGVDVSPNPIRRGKPVTLTYYFKPLRKFRRDWGIFLHLQGTPPSTFYKVFDHNPVGGLYPSRKWRKNRVFRSSHTFVMPRDFEGKTALFYSGLWRGNERMIVPRNVPSDGTNRILLAKVPVLGKGLERPIYTVKRVKNPPRIDGKLDDPIWSRVASTGRLRTYNNRRSHFRTEVRMAWDQTYLYVAFDCDDDDIWSTYTKRDDPLFKQENVEFFIDANRNRRDYVELQVSPAGVIFDSFFKTYRSPKPWGQLSYDSGMLVKVGLNGTLNNPKDTDKGWVVEMRLPLRKLGPAHNIPPKHGDEWLINMYRLERSRRSRREDHAWSPVTLGRGGDYHRIDRFGILRFSKEFADASSKTAPAPTSKPASRASKIPANARRIPRLMLHPIQKTRKIRLYQLKRPVMVHPYYKNKHNHGHGHGHDHGHDHHHGNPKKLKLPSVPRVKFAKPKTYQCPPGRKSPNQKLPARPKVYKLERPLPPAPSPQKKPASRPVR